MLDEVHLLAVVKLLLAGRGDERAMLAALCTAIFLVFGSSTHHEGVSEARVDPVQGRTKRALFHADDTHAVDLKVGFEQLGLARRVVLFGSLRRIDKVLHKMVCFHLGFAYQFYFLARCYSLEARGRVLLLLYCDL